MRIVKVKVKVYEFKELTPVIKEKILKEFAEINVDFDWYTCTYEDANRAGLEIKEFDLEVGSINVEMVVSLTVRDVIERILKDHGPKCETYKTAKKYKGKYTPKFEAEFMAQISKDYLDILRKDYEYRISEEGIIETIEGIDWEFTEDGKHFTLKEE